MGVLPPEIGGSTVAVAMDSHAVDAQLRCPRQAQLSIWQTLSARSLRTRTTPEDLQERRRSRRGSPLPYSRPTSLTYSHDRRGTQVRTIAQPTSDQCWNNHKALTSLFGSVVPWPRSGHWRRRMGRIDACVEHGNDNAFTPGTNAARHGGAIPNLIGANERLRKVVT